MEKLAHAVGADPDALHRLLRALAVLGVVQEVAAGRFALADLGQPLRADHPKSLRSSVLLLGDPATWHAWGALTHSVRTGDPAFDHVQGEPVFDYFARHPDLSGVFNRAMGEGTRLIAPELPRMYDFAGVGTVVDVGGGNGVLLAEVLRAAPDAAGVLFDIATGVAGAAEVLRHAGVADRCRIVAGDFFESVPGGDILLLASILHDWDDQRCTTLLRNCRRSIAAGGRLLALEAVLPLRVDTPGATSIVMSDINMLVNTGGRKRTEVEFGRLFDAGGFDLVEVLPPLGGSQVRVLVAAPA